MNTLRVKEDFRDESNFFIIHHKGDTIVIKDDNRVSRLIATGLCEKLEVRHKTEASDNSGLELTNLPKVRGVIAREKSKSSTRRKKEA